jgi:hypothetical protein
LFEGADISYANFEDPYRFRLTPIDQMPSVGTEMRSIINQTLKQTRPIQSRRVRDFLQF